MNKVMHETEVKFMVADRSTLARILRKAGFRITQKRTHEVNTLYDLVTTAGGELRARGELLRLRQNGKKWLLTHKGKATYTAHKSRVETETEIADGGAMGRILLRLGFAPVFRYEKYRTVWKKGKGEVMVDETPIGDIAEIEGPAEWIDKTARLLGITQAQYITDSYASLFFQWKERTGNSAAEMTWKSVGKNR